MKYPLPPILLVFSDAESFDYGNGFYGLGTRAGVGFKVAILHPLDIPIIESTAMNIDVGKVIKSHLCAGPTVSLLGRLPLPAGGLHLAGQYFPGGRDSVQPRGQEVLRC